MFEPFSLPLDYTISSATATQNSPHLKLVTVRSVNLPVSTHMPICSLDATLLIRNVSHL